MKDRERYRRHFGVEPPDDLGKFDVWPMYAASFIRRPREADAGDEAVPGRVTLPGQFDLIPHWATDTTIVRHTYNARSETVAAPAPGQNRPGQATLMERLFLTYFLQASSFCGKF